MRKRHLFASAAFVVADYLFPEVCPFSGCGRPSLGPCDRCRPLLPASGRFPGDDLLALVSYEGLGADLVGALKFHNCRGVARWAGRELALRLRQSQGGLVDLVTWVPCSIKGYEQRGYDPGQLVANALARELDLPATRLFRRIGRKAQTGANAKMRDEGPGLVVVTGGKERRALFGGSVLVVDDVTTTGASLRVAARLLLAQGAESVRAAVIAHTPKHTM